VIGVGLVFVSQGLSNQLKALTSVQEHAVLVVLADRTLRELEAERLAGPPPSASASGAFAPPYQQYQWTLHAQARTDLLDPQGQPLFADVTCTVQRPGLKRPILGRLSAIWRTDWVPPEWF